MLKEIFTIIHRHDPKAPPPKDPEPEIPGVPEPGPTTAHDDAFPRKRQPRH